MRFLTPHSSAMGVNQSATPVIPKISHAPTGPPKIQSRLHGYRPLQKNWGRKLTTWNPFFHFWLQPQTSQRLRLGHMKWGKAGLHIIRLKRSGELFRSVVAAQKKDAPSADLTRKGTSNRISRSNTSHWHLLKERYLRDCWMAIRRYYTMDTRK